MGFLEIFKKKKGTGWLLLGLAAGILLFLFGSAENGKTETDKTEDPAKEYTAADAYVALLERRVTELLERMDGVADVHVIITADSCAEVLYAQNGSYDNGTLTEKEYVLADGDKPIRIKLIYPRLRGIAVVCRGGSNPIQREKIVSLLSSLFDLPSNKVYVTG